MPTPKKSSARRLKKSDAGRLGVYVALVHAVLNTQRVEDATSLREAVKVRCACVPGLHYDADLVGRALDQVERFSRRRDFPPPVAATAPRQPPPRDVGFGRQEAAALLDRLRVALAKFNHVTFDGPRAMPGDHS